MKTTRWIGLGCTAAMVLAACGDDENNGMVNNGMTNNGMTNNGMTNNGMTNNGMTNNGMTNNGMTNNGMTNNGMTNNGTTGPTAFRLTIENLSGNSGLPTPIAPSLWALAGLSNPIFQSGSMDTGAGLEALAEDGSTAALAASLDGADGVAAYGGVNEPVGPGGMVSVEFDAAPGDMLYWAGMFVQSNDAFVANATPISLFGNDGAPIASQDVTGELALWDAGTEANQAPGQGPDQAPRQAGPDTGAREGLVRAFSDTTRAIPRAGALVEVSVEVAGGDVTVHLKNASETHGLLPTPIAPVFFATHSDGWSFFADGTDASAGLQMLAEDGSPAGLVGEHDGAAGTATVGAVTAPDERPADAPGPMMPGETFSVTVTPGAEAPLLSFGAMVVESNDAFLALNGGGVALLDEQGTLRAANDIAAEIGSRLAVWDAGTEANEVPGVGANQAPRQAAANTGPDDPTSGVRLYADPTNDLAGVGLGGFVDVSVVNGANAGEFVVTITNTSGQTAYPGLLTPVVYATHADAFSLFETDIVAPAALESLAEDGDGAALEAMAAGSADVSSSGVWADRTSLGAGPLGAGEEYSFTVTADAAHPMLSFSAMVVPSNDTLMALRGLSLFDAAGAARSDAELATDVAAMLMAYDAGTEANQAGAGGADQAPRQAGPNTGAAEGDRTVRPMSGWPHGDPMRMFRVTLETL